ncbi:uncharacterized protein L969DRAFT_92652 [Mixia osmundae IAM 14324]|uniref:GPN-loop GTPase n=1 Tax=Mixia osmundae (strain CBS 9802 / IAM 14324 / JCM 22182 / KY 12970) TaxID=764103 RepID=G7DY60_MIXOS|nr:uncharacterized protein L969DRAFT_92652 [Mixia osmundae IAM 14324]KEI41422.1 hypothetical protein L969DRAFT_92652 [Mixia osmundae IAM 14324]GAA95520.1 hypothetical protein E5Q_02175 [Mixia osmundae IAM 14324]
MPDFTKSGSIILVQRLDLARPKHLRQRLVKRTIGGGDRTCVGPDMISLDQVKDDVRLLYIVITSAAPLRNETSMNEATSSSAVAAQQPTCIIVIGMAGSGKTTFLQRLNSHLHSQSKPPYILNLDPAVSHLPFKANIDIRDTVDYSEVMKQYNLGPNGGILTALNLFTTKFDQVLGFVEKRAGSHKHVLLDTPGQIEIFTWSASGAIITDSLASSLPTCVAYIIDTPRTTAPATFMSNMLYACSILYKTRLPFILVFNKTDVTPHHFALEWMRDFEAFQDALQQNRQSTDEPGFMNSLLNSMSLMLDEFYKHLRAVGVSAMTGAGFDDFLRAVDEARKEYENDYKPELDRLRAEKAAQSAKNKDEQIQRLVQDMKLSGGQNEVLSRPSVRADPAAVGPDELDQDEDEGELLERDDEGAPPPRIPGRRLPGGIYEDDNGGRWPAPR